MMEEDLGLGKLHLSIPKEEPKLEKLLGLPEPKSATMQAWADTQSGKVIFRVTAEGMPPMRFIADEKPAAILLAELVTALQDLNLLRDARAAIRKFSS